MFTSGDGDIIKFVQRTTLADSISNMHGTSSEPNMYKRDSHRIDFCVHTLTIEVCIVICSITPFDLLTFSVHRGIYVNRNIVQYLQDYF